MEGWTPFQRSDYDSEVWKRVRAHFEARLNTARIKNEGRLSIEETNRLRGRIFEMKAFLALSPDETAPPESDDAK